MVATEVLREPAPNAGGSAGMLLEHELVPFASYPYEWPAEMLYAAADLTLTLASSALDAGYGLKDATPYNVLFRGSKPVFIDVPSFEKRDPADPVWLPYAQFVRTFLLPLAAEKYLGLRAADLLLARRDGVTPSEVYRWLPLSRRLRSPFLSLVTVPTLVDKTGLSAKLNDANLKAQDPAAAGFILRSLFARLRRTLRKLAPDHRRSSMWSQYMSTQQHYSGEQLEAKRSFLEEYLRENAPHRTLDIGCNTGLFSAIAASAGSSVVSFDTDGVALGQVWHRAQNEGLPILPLMSDIARPTPAVGWMNRENPSFLARAQGKFDLVLMYAVLHHLVITERVPLDRVFELVAHLTKRDAIVEFVGQNDPMFKVLLRGRGHLHLDHTREQFEQLAQRSFSVVRAQRVEGTERWLYLLRKH
jgi:SAM-dependent methyltransferase